MSSFCLKLPLYILGERVEVEINLDLLKEKYLNYKIEKQELPSDSVDVNIFEAEFKDFLVDEMGADSSIFQKDINEILNMSIENGKIVDNSDSQEGNNDDSLILEVLNDANSEAALEESKDSQTADELPMLTDENEGFISFNEDKTADEKTVEDLFTDGGNFEAETFTDAPKTEENNSGDTENSDSSDNGIDSKLQKKLDKIFNSKKAKKFLDTDGDGKISDEEKEKFIEYIKAYGGDVDELDEEDIKLASQDIKTGKFSYDKDLSETDNDTKTADDTTDSTNASPSSSKSSGVSGGGSTGGGSGVSGGGSSGSASGATSASNSNTNTDLSDNMTIDQKIEKLKGEQQDVKTELDNSRNELKEVYSGENEAVKDAQENTDESEKTLEEAIDEDESLSDEEKEAIKENVENIKTAQQNMDETKTSIAEKDGEIANAQNEVSAAQSTVDGLEAAVATFDTSNVTDEKQKAEIEAQKAEVEAQLNDAKKDLEDKQEQQKALEEEKVQLEKTLSEQEKAYNEAMQASEKMQEDLAKKSEKSAQAVAKALEDFNENTQKVEETKTKEAETIQKTIDENQTKYDDIQSQIDELEAEKTKQDNQNKTGTYVDDLNLGDDLTDAQKSELATIKSLYENNKNTYDDIAAKFKEKTGVAIPSELICGIHYRESSGDFSTYLHNGEPLGQVTTLVPAGIYFDNFTDAAVDALVREYDDSYKQLCSSDGVPSDFSTLSSALDYAERYNGTGYRSHGCKSAYVYSGTSAYTGGMYVSDGNFSATTKDSRVGVAAIMKALREV